MRTALAVAINAAGDGPKETTMKTKTTKRSGNSNFRGGYFYKPTYTCHSCGKRTRETGGGESSSELCAFCYEEAGIENGCSDAGHGPEREALVLQLAKLRSEHGKPMPARGTEWWDGKPAREGDVDRAEDLDDAARDLIVASLAASSTATAEDRVIRTIDERDREVLLATHAKLEGQTLETTAANLVRSGVVRTV